MLELLARRASSTEPGFTTKRARWALMFDAQGRFLDVAELGEAGQRGNKGQSFPKCPEYDRKFKQGGGRSEFLLDALHHIIHIIAPHADDPEYEEKLVAKQRHFVDLLRRAAREAMPELEPVAKALTDGRTLEAIRKRLWEVKHKPTDRATLNIAGSFPVESTTWHEFWRREYQSSSGAGKSPGRPRKSARMVCFVTGQVTEPLDTHPKIEGLDLVGGQRMGDVLVGMDKDAFSSYFLKQSANAAVSKEAAYRYRAALNDLIRNSSRKLAGALVVYWYKDRVEPKDDPLAWLYDPPVTAELNALRRAAELLDAIKSGRRPDLAGNRFYALTLSGMSGRVMVRDWMEWQFEELVGNVRCWFDDLSIVSSDGSSLARDPEFMAVLGATVRELDDLPPPFEARMWRVAVRGEPIPRAALAMALGRFRTDIIDKDKSPNHARMGLMKAYFVRQDRRKGQEESDMKRHLNDEHPSPAYHCGRLMAVLAKLQQAALGDVGAGVVQRYYPAASATPALVLGRLMRGAQHHLNKLEGRGLAHWFEDRLGEIASRLGDAVPQTLTLEEQSLFAIGYYQQLVDMKARKSDDSQKGE